MTRIVALPVAVPLLAAVLTLAIRGSLGIQRVVSVVAAVIGLAVAVAITAAVSGGDVLAMRVGGWPPRFAISLVADPLSALMLLVSALMLLVCLAFALARGEDRSPFFHPLVQVLMLGVAGAFLTADLFNLFVFIEVMLIASYVLLTLGGAARQVRAAGVYISMNLLASSLLLVGVALVYAAAGTVNMAELAGAAAESPGTALAGAVVLTALAVKGALVPVHGWLPKAYPIAPPAVAALFSGLLTKVGIYGLYRVYGVVFAGDQSLRVPILLVAAATMSLGVLGAIGRNGMREILSFHIVSQVGYMVMGLGLFGTPGLAAGIFYILHHIVVKTSLFLAAGAVETTEGTGDVDRLGGLMRSRPVLAASFLAAAFSLAGLPPLSGFFAKLLLLRAAFEEADYGVAAVAIVVSLLTLTSMVKIWNGVFWGGPGGVRPEGLPPGEPALAVPRIDPRQGDPVPRSGGAGLVAPAAVLATVSLVLGLWPQGLLMLTERAAAILVDPAPYVRAVFAP